MFNTTVCMKARLFTGTEVALATVGTSNRPYVTCPKRSSEYARADPCSSGILLHPTSLHGPYGIGDIGPAAHAWIDTLADAKQTWWQMLPVGPTGFGDSPYQSFSTFAGNLNLIGPDLSVLRWPDPPSAFGQSAFSR